MILDDYVDAEVICKLAELSETEATDNDRFPASADPAGGDKVPQ